MRKIQTETSKAMVLFVEIPSNAYNFKVFLDIGRPYISYFEKTPIIDVSRDYLPEGNWQLLGRIEDITEEQAELVVDRWSSHPDFFADYPLTWQNREHYNETAIESFQSFCDSLDVPKNSVVLIEPKK